jgi:pimeloyl-ACP methyl ester carboxylesterase
MAPDCRTLILLPGMDGTGQLFAGFVNGMPEAFKTVTVRYPADRCLSYSELASIVRASCPVSESFVLVAESFSTPLAIQYAATKPMNLAALVLCAGFASSPLQGWRRRLGSLFAPMFFRIPLPRFVAKRWLTSLDAPPSLVTALRVAISSVQPSVLASRARAVLACDVRADLGQLTVPILYLQAKQDRLVGAYSLEEIRRTKPQVAVAAFEGPHLLLQRDPKGTTKVIAEFVRNLAECGPQRGDTI